MNPRRHAVSHPRPSPIRRPLRTALIILAAAPLPACALGLHQVRQLHVVRDAPLAEMLVDSAAWLGDERGLAVGGWTQWPADPLVCVYPMGAPAVRMERAGSPRFALSPSRREIAYWVSTGGDWVQLGVAPVTGGQPRYLGPPRRTGPGMFLAWPTDDVIWALVQDGETCAALAVSTGDGATRPLVEVVGGQWLRLRHHPGFGPIAVWAGESRKCVLLDAHGRSQELSADLDYDRPTPHSEQYLYFDDSGALWMGGLPGMVPAKIAAQAGAAAWTADGSALAYSSAEGLFAVWPPTAARYRVSGSALDHGGAAQGMLWSADSGALAYWRNKGTSGELRVADLGLCEVLVRVRFDSPVKPEVGQRVWATKRLWKDKQGSVTEADWTAVKGEFSVTRWQVDQPSVVEAVSVGEMAGVLERVAGQEGARAAATPLGLSEEKQVAPVPGLLAWLHGTRRGGKVEQVILRSRPLGAAG